MEENQHLHLLWIPPDKFFITSIFKFSSVQFSCSVVSNSLWPHELQLAWPLCPSPTPRVHPNPCPSSRWCHPTISSSVVPFSSCPQPFPASGYFPMNQLFASGGQNIGVSASTSETTQNDLLKKTTSREGRCMGQSSWWWIKPQFVWPCWKT